MLGKNPNHSQSLVKTFRLHIHASTGELLQHPTWCLKYSSEHEAAPKMYGYVTVIKYNQIPASTCSLSLHLDGVLYKQLCHSSNVGWLMQGTIWCCPLASQHCCCLGLLQEEPHIINMTLTLSLLTCFLIKLSRIWTSLSGCSGYKMTYPPMMVTSANLAVRKAHQSI